MRKAIFLLTLTLLVPRSVPAQFLGSTFEARKQAYIADQGRYWQQWFPAAMKMPVFAWLERPDQGNNRARISEEISYITDFSGRNGQPKCSGKYWWPFKNCWWTGDQPAQILVSRIYYQYYQDKRVITESDATTIRKKLKEIALSPGVWCAVANYHFRYLVTAYLYAERIEDIPDVYFPPPSGDRYKCPQSFTYNGRRYTGGNTYSARQLYYDYLNTKIDEWLAYGTVEDFTTGDYFYAQIQSIALLYDFTKDAALKKKAGMYLDWLVFSYTVSFSANHPSGGHGRNYTALELSGRDFFPYTVFFNLDRSTAESITELGTNTELYVTTYRYPALLRDMFESLNGANRTESNDYYRIIRGAIPKMGAPWWMAGVVSTGYRYDYITPNYNLGGTGIGTGWELNIRASGTPFKVWINSCDDVNVYGCNTESDKGDGGGELLYMGIKGFQHRNALFVNGSGNLHQALGSDRWDESSSESGWRFFRKGPVAIAVKLETSSALEVCTIGVDYSSYGAFKSAIINNARLTADRFVTSKGVEIRRGYVDLGSDFSQLPFERLEVWEGHAGKNDERKIVNWQNDVMTVERNGAKLEYNFSDWVSNAAGQLPAPQLRDTQAPAPPANVKVKGNTSGE